jgi:hypothetical protein
MKSVLSIAALATVPALLVGCGSFQLGDNVTLKLDAEHQTANLEVQMSDGLEVSLNGEFPLANGQGRIYFAPATQTETAKIGIEANLAVIAGGSVINMETISTLPSGAMLPVAMTPPLLVARVLKNANYDISAAFTLVPELQLGAVVGITQMNAQYIPTGGLAICQNFRNENKVAFAAICVYGPTATTSGGIFIGSNFGDVLNNSEISTPANSSSVARSAMALSSSSAPFVMNRNVLSTSSNVHSSNWVDSNSGVKMLTSRTRQKAANNILKILRKR